MSFLNKSYWWTEQFESGNNLLNFHQFYHASSIPGSKFKTLNLKPSSLINTLKFRNILVMYQHKATFCEKYKVTNIKLTICHRKVPFSCQPEQDRSSSVPQSLGADHCPYWSNVKKGAVKPNQAFIVLVSFRKRKKKTKMIGQGCLLAKKKKNSTQTSVNGIQKLQLNFLQKSKL